MIPTLLFGYQKLNNEPDLLKKVFVFFRFLAGNPDYQKKEGIYYRLVYSPELEEICLQAVLYYRRQLFPYHINDYHPFYAYFDKSYQLIRLVYDSSHHRSMIITPCIPPVNLTVRFPWHGYKFGRSAVSLPFKANYFELTDEVLASWWLQYGKPQFKLRTKFVDPWHIGLTSRGNIDGNFRDEVLCPYCGDVSFLDTMDLQSGEKFHLKVTCHNKHRFVVDYDAYAMKIVCTK